MIFQCSEIPCIYPTAAEVLAGVLVHARPTPCWHGHSIDSSTPPYISKSHYSPPNRPNTDQTKHMILRTFTPCLHAYGCRVHFCYSTFYTMPACIWLWNPFPSFNVLHHTCMHMVVVSISVIQRFTPCLHANGCGIHFLYSTFYTMPACIWLWYPFPLFNVLHHACMHMVVVSISVIQRFTPCLHAYGCGIHFRYSTFYTMPACIWLWYPFLLFNVLHHACMHMVVVSISVIQSFTPCLYANGCGIQFCSTLWYSMFYTNHMIMADYHCDVIIATHGNLISSIFLISSGLSVMTTVKAPSSYWVCTHKMHTSKILFLGGHNLVSLLVEFLLFVWEQYRPFDLDQAM